MVMSLRRRSKRYMALSINFPMPCCPTQTNERAAQHSPTPVDAILLLGRRIIISTSSHACPACLSRVCGGVNGGAPPSRQSASCRILFALFSFFPEGAPRAVSLRHSSGSLALVFCGVEQAACVLVPDTEDRPTSLTRAKEGQAENSFDAEPTRPPAPETLCAPSFYVLFVVSMPVADDLSPSSTVALARTRIDGLCLILPAPALKGPDLALVWRVRFA
jgi:hypothetical protein